MKKTACILLTSLMVTTSCSSVTRSTLTGVGTGVTMGSLSAYALAGKEKGKAALYSALTMGLIGGIAGYFTHEKLQERDQKVRKETLFNLDKYGVSTPLSTDNSEFNYQEKSSQKVIIFTDDSKLMQRLGK